MTYRMKYILSSLLLICAGISACQAQKLVDERDQATGWYVPVNLKVTTERGKAKEVEVTLYKDNTLVKSFQARKGEATVSLDLDNNYSLIVEQEGYRAKTIMVDTHVPAQQVEYAAFPCFVNLEAADKFTHSDPFYLDFPGAVIRWDDDIKGFIPSVKYVTDIQSKIGMLQAQMTPN
ncbi:MAG: hypothetical protein JST45_10625 [Bacteroidetes bacterium]|nr:hypothetical protein [Bacteroidota bacterium]